MNPLDRLHAARARLPAAAAFTGMTSAWLHGLDMDPCNPIEVLISPEAGVSGRAGLFVRRSAFSQSEVICLRGLPATSMVRAIADVCATRNLVEATVVADAALHKCKVTLAQLAAWIDANPHRYGIRNLRRVVTLAEPATESPMESRLRLALVLGRLPRPQAQFKIHDQRGRVLGRVDLYYEAARLGIEYDGSAHRDSLADDAWRQNLLLEAGVRLLRFTARDVLGRPDSVVRQVRDMLKATSAGRNASAQAATSVSAGRKRS